MFLESYAMRYIITPIRGLGPLRALKNNPPPPASLRGEKGGYS
jgi:hypothetical protein